MAAAASCQLSAVSSHHRTQFSSWQMIWAGQTSAGTTRKVSVVQYRSRVVASYTADRKYSSDQFPRGSTNPRFNLWRCCKPVTVVKLSRNIFSPCFTWSHPQFAHVCHVEPHVCHVEPCTLHMCPVDPHVCHVEPRTIVSRRATCVSHVEPHVCHTWIHMCATWIHMCATWSHMCATPGYTCMSRETT